MNRALCALGALITVVAIQAITTPSVHGDVAKDVKRITGQWQVVSASLNGKPAPDAVLKIVFVFTSEKTIKIEGGPKEAEFTFKLDDSSTPPKITIVATKGSHIGQEGIGFYKFEEDNLHFYMPNSPNGDDPPKSLEDERAKKLAHFVLKKK